MTRSIRRPEWLVPAGLVLLTAVPALGGALRLTSLVRGGADPASQRFFDSPAPVVVHIVGAVVFCAVGALQFHPGLRRRRPGWHRAAGRVLIPCGLAAALSGLWMALFYPHPPTDGPLLVVLRLVAGTAMAAAVVLALLAIRRRDIPRHRAWITRGYAIAQGAGTQAVLFGVLAAATGSSLGETDPALRTLVHGLGWALNLVIAERVLRRRSAPAGPHLPRGVALTAVEEGAGRGKLSP